MNTENKSQLRKITEIIKPCNHPEHYPPKYLVLRDGVYEYTCPACGKSSFFRVERPNL
jgi:hypothetical protein